jgi:thiol:disulfide interchange protein DsbD
MLWGALALGFGLWLGGCDLALWRLGASWNRAPQIFGTAAMALGLALLAAPALGALRPQGALEAQPDETADEGFVRTVSTATELEQALASAQPLGQPILVDFTASWCAVCKEIDATILRDPPIKARLKTVSVIRADLSAYTAESQALMRRFDIVGPPTMLFVNATSGREIEDGRTIGSVSVETFLRQLDRAGA